MPKNKQKKPKTRGPGRPRTDKTAYTFVRSTPGQRLLWDAAARFVSQSMQLPHDLSLNAWVVMTLDEAAAKIAAIARGEVPDSKVVAKIDAVLEGLKP